MTDDFPTVSGSPRRAPQSKGASRAKTAAALLAVLATALVALPGFSASLADPLGGLNCSGVQVQDATVREVVCSRPAQPSPPPAGPAPRTKDPVEHGPPECDTCNSGPGESHVEWFGRCSGYASGAPATCETTFARSAYDEIRFQPTPFDGSDFATYIFRVYDGSTEVEHWDTCYGGYLNAWSLYTGYATKVKMEVGTCGSGPAPNGSFWAEVGYTVYDGCDPRVTWC